MRASAALRAAAAVRASVGVIAAPLRRLGVTAEAPAVVPESAFAGPGVPGSPAPGVAVSGAAVSGAAVPRPAVPVTAVPEPAAAALSVSPVATPVWPITALPSAAASRARPGRSAPACAVRVPPSAPASTIAGTLISAKSTRAARAARRTCARRTVAPAASRSPIFVRPGYVIGRTSAPCPARPAVAGRAVRSRAAARTGGAAAVGTPSCTASGCCTASGGATAPGPPPGSRT